MKKVAVSADFKQLLKEHRIKTGKDLPPVRRHKNSLLPPSYAHCENCNAPASYLYVNDGCKKSQLRCKVCNTLFQSNHIRKEGKARYWCPYCGRALYRWKAADTHTIYKYSISYGISARMTRQILRDVHNIHISHQTVLNCQKNAAVLAWNFIQKYQGTVSDSQIIGDETYIRITDQWGYTWFVIGAQSKAVWAFNISDNRGVLPALSTITKVMENVPDHTQSSIEFIADGNPSYDAAILAFNSNNVDKSIKRLKVIGLSNDDDESKQYRPLKQLIERLNRTYKFHTRARCGFKNINGAAVLTTLFVTYYNFLRPHSSLNFNPPIILSNLAAINTIQGKWLKILELAA
ncbi:MAG: DDE-type integrase/transposase/recombinase [Candidatus Latescibacter sp.]|nr:DDE-type integrase/transposase/recombinase [Candidatus Latescibacter sp.]